MSPVRFRIRTIMIAIAALAVVMGALSALRLPFFDNMVAFTAAVVFLAAATVAFLVAVIVFLARFLGLVVVAIARVVVDLFACAVDSWGGRMGLRQFSWMAERPFRRPEPERSGEAARV